MRTSILAFTLVSALGLVGCMDPDTATDDLTAEELGLDQAELAVDDGAAPASLDRASTDTHAPAGVAAAVPGTTTLGHEYLGCTGSVAAYLITWSTPGATRYEVDFNRAGGAWASFYRGTGKAKQFTTSNSTQSVGIRARGCNASGCGPYKTISFIPFACSGGGPL